MKSTWLANERTPVQGAIPSPELLGGGRSTNTAFGVHLRKPLAGVVNPVLYQSTVHHVAHNSQLWAYGHPTHQINAWLVSGSANIHRQAVDALTRSISIHPLCSRHGAHHDCGVFKPP